jgi:hypothetical protein
VLLVMGTREQAEALKQEADELLSGLGLSLSRHKTLVTHVDHSFDLLGFHIVRKQRRQGPASVRLHLPVHRGARSDEAEGESAHDAVHVTASA